MLKQQINLYRPFELPLPKTAYITYRQFLVGNIVVFFFLLIVYFFMLWEISGLNKEKETLSKQNIQLKQQFYAVKNQYPSLFFTQDIQHTLEQMEKTLTAQSKFFSVITHPTAFSLRLIALAQIDTPGIWLTDILISNTDKLTKLAGYTLVAADLQTYLANIGKNPIFADTELTINSLESAKDNESALSFQITMVSQS